MPAPIAEPPSRPLILLVDDDPTVRLTLARALTDRGYEVCSAADGPAAITILEGLATLPVIAITDLHMASGSGEELARTLARRCPQLPVIFMTAYVAMYRAAYLPGPILEKPFRAEQLCELIASVLTAASERRAHGNRRGYDLDQRSERSAPEAAPVTTDPGQSANWLPHVGRKQI
jgi:CheY-like chemotaxis protein